MLATLEELLRDIRAQGLKEIEPHLHIPHMPTIGEMYEGLSKELIGRALFEPFDLRVRSGQIQGPDGRYSPQIDCMLVIGDGDKLPYSDNYIYRTDKVVAVFEVKKTLNQSEIEDALAKFVKLTSLAVDEWGRPRPGSDFETAAKIHKDAFRAVCRTAYPPEGNPNSLSPTERTVFEFLMMDACFPLRIILSFGGYATEDGFRQGYSSALQTTNNLWAAPSLTICSDLSITRANGMPFAPERSLKTGWDIYYSQQRVAIRNLLNILWYKITKLYAKDFLWITDGKVYTHNVLMSLRKLNSLEIQLDDLSGIPRRDLLKSEEFSPEPYLISIEEYVLLRELMQHEAIDISNEAEFLGLLNKGVTEATTAAVVVGCPIRSPSWETIAELIKHVERTGLISKQGESLVRAASRCVVLMTAEGMFAGENRDGRFTHRFGSPGVLLPDTLRPTSTVLVTVGADIHRRPSDPESWLALLPEKRSMLMDELHNWTGRAVTNELREPIRVPSINLVVVRHDDFRISSHCISEGRYEIRLSDAVELLLRDVIFRWLALPNACVDVGDPNLEVAGLLLGQFNKNLFQLQQDAFPYELRVPKCKERLQYAQLLHAVTMQFLIAHSAAHILLGHQDYAYTAGAGSLIDEQEVVLSEEATRDRHAVEWAADVTAVRYLCANRFAPFGSHASKKSKSKNSSTDIGVTALPFEETILLVGRAIAIATMYSERAWFYIKDESLLSHQYPQWRLTASVGAIRIFLHGHFSGGVDSLKIPVEHIMKDILEARKGIIWAKVDPQMIIRFTDYAQTNIGRHWQSKIRPLLDQHAFVALPTFS